MMEFRTNILNKNVNIVVKKKIRTRHTYLKIKEKNLIEISTNIFFTMGDAKALIEKKKSWIEKHLISFNKKVENENTYLFLGQYYNLDKNSKELDEFYRNKSKEIIPALVEKYAEIMALYPSSIKYRKNKRTWGSCNYKNGLNFNILLVKFPLEVIEYVVIHELAHIKEKNHSKKFWSLVEKYCVDYKDRIKLFKTFL